MSGNTGTRFVPIADAATPLSGSIMSAAPRSDQPSRLEPFRLRGANFNMLVLRLLDPRPEAVVPALGDQFRRAPGFLRFAPIVLGLGDLEVPAAEVDFAGFAFRSARLGSADTGGVSEPS